MSAPIIGITCSSEEAAKPYAEAVAVAGGTPLLLDMAQAQQVDAVLASIDALLLTGGADIHPAHYGEELAPRAHVRADPRRDAHELPLLEAALRRDMPILGICRGMQAINVALGGKLVQDLPNHMAADPDKPLMHRVFIPPGARLTGILGLCGFTNVNSSHHQGLKLAQKAPGLLASAFSLKDGIIECLESPSYIHRWVVGVQWHPERRGEVSGVHQKLFTHLVAQAQQTRNAV